MDIIIPIITFVVGLIIGVVIGIYYLRRQMTNMSMDNQQMKQMAKQMGFNLNQKQLNQMNKMMKNKKGRNK